MGKKISKKRGDWNRGKKPPERKPPVRNVVSYSDRTGLYTARF